MNNNNRHKTPLKERAQTPARHVFSPNDDDFERAQVRAARAAASRRKSTVRPLPDLQAPGIESDKLLAKNQILELFQNCIKLASENKINQRNTWELKLNDHLSDIINVEDNDSETNFQKASCTLEAGVKIYSYRVDSVHSEVYKVLGGLNRTSNSDKNSNVRSEEGEGGGVEEDEGEAKKEHHKKVQKIDVDYDRTSKEVDVRILKETLWERIQDFSMISQEDFEERSQSAVSFKRLLNSFPARCAAAAPENISVHLCFICLLHLANEHSLKIQDCSTLDELSVSNIQSF